MLRVRHNTTWGPWTLSRERCLVNTNNGYEIDLDAIKSTADVMNWLMHMSAKSNKSYGDGYLYFLSTAFADILHYSNIDTSKNAEFNGFKLVTKYLKALQPKRYISPKKRHMVFERDNFRCIDCGASPDIGAVLEVDHTIPISKGGTNEMDNLRTLCLNCNRGKADRIVNYCSGHLDV